MVSCSEIKEKRKSCALMTQGVPETIMCKSLLRALFNLGIIAFYPLWNSSLLLTTHCIGWCSSCLHKHFSEAKQVYPTIGTLWITSQIHSITHLYCVERVLRVRLR